MLNEQHTKIILHVSQSQSSMKNIIKIFKFLRNFFILHDLFFRSQKTYNATWVRERERDKNMHKGEIK